jgi:hypothetical protein
MSTEPGPDVSQQAVPSCPLVQQPRDGTFSVCQSCRLPARPLVFKSWLPAHVRTATWTGWETSAAACRQHEANEWLQARVPGVRANTHQRDSCPVLRAADDKLKAESRSLALAGFAAQHTLSRRMAGRFSRLEQTLLMICCTRCHHSKACEGSRILSRPG